MRLGAFKRKTAGKKASKETAGAGPLVGIFQRRWPAPVKKLAVVGCKEAKRKNQ